MLQHRASCIRSLFRFAGFRAFVSLLLLFSQLLPTLDARAYTRSQSGRWSPTSNWGAPAVHMALLRSNNLPYHSKVLWWLGLGNHEEFHGGVWGWRPKPVDSCLVYPGTDVLDPLDFSDANAGSPFCSGHSQLADGRLLLAGGTQPGSEFGVRQTVIFDPATPPDCAWKRRDSMAVHRWYANVTTLADGRALTLSGSHHQHLEFFGGLKSGETTPIDTAVFRYGIGGGGRSETPVRTFASMVWPSGRIGHTGVYNSALGSYTSVFGGKLANGIYTNELWELRRLTNPAGADYSYIWTKSTTPGQFDTPLERWRHVAVPVPVDTASMLVFGGIGKNEDGEDLMLEDVWLYGFRNQTPRWYEVEVTNPSSSDAPGPRADHVTLWHDLSRSMLVFGGRSTPTSDPTDNALYRLKFESDMTQATWSKLTVSGPPDARAKSALAYSSSWKHDGHTHAFLFGGENEDGKFNDLWDLKLNATLDTLQWTNLSVADPLGGAPPSPRSGHTMVADGGNHWLYVFGGTDRNGTWADDTVYKAHLGGHTEVLDEDRAWEPYASHDAGALTGHIAVFEDGPIYARKPEIYSDDEDDGEWDALDTPRLQEWYPQAFVMKPDTVFVAGPDFRSRVLSLSTGSWSEFPASAGDPFKGGSAVMYRPGKVMKAGSRDTDGAGGTARGMTATINLNAGGSATWARSDSMAGRVNHNLVVLPNGEVLVVGGTGVINNEADASAEKRPELWDPDAAGGTGDWYGLGILEQQPTQRDYHSTALLLPDGRVLCASGNANKTLRNTAEIYCPPYLFNGDNMATRPNLLSSTARWRYNADVTFAVNGDTTIRRACLIHPGSVTHGQDMAQRYIPLTLLTKLDTPGVTRHYFVKAPPDSFTAPPGDYLLFASNSVGVPSIARWVRVGSETAGQYDVGSEPPSFSTTYIYCDAISSIYWPAPADDDLTGAAQAYDIRYSWSPITEQNFPNATPMAGLGLPLHPGTITYGDAFNGLSPATTVYIGGKVLDRMGVWSALGTAEFATLPSCGGGGYGTSSQRSRGEAGRAPTAERVATSLRVRPLATPSTLLSSHPTVRLVGEYSGETGSVWRLHYVDFADNTDLLQATLGASVVQTSAGGDWSTRETTALPEGAVGLRTVANGERVVFPGGTLLESFEAEPRGFECVAATHSRFGDLLASQSPDSLPEFAPGDTLDLAFSPDEAATSGAGWFFRVVVPEGVGASRARPGTRPTTRPILPEPVTLDLPIEFALHAPRPNPFSHATQVRFDLPRTSRVEIELFDVQGRRVASLLDETREAGRHMVVWDGRADGNHRAPAGIYLCRMRAGAFHAEARISLLP